MLAMQDGREPVRRLRANDSLGTLLRLQIDSGIVPRRLLLDSVMDAVPRSRPLFKSPNVGGMVPESPFEDRER